MFREITKGSNNNGRPDWTKPNKYCFFLHVLMLGLPDETFDHETVYMLFKVPRKLFLNGTVDWLLSVGLNRLKGLSAYASNYAGLRTQSRRYNVNL